MVENNRKINLCGIGSNSNDEKKLTFEEENEQYAGEEITVRIYLLKSSILDFLIKKNNIKKLLKQAKTFNM